MKGVPNIGATKWSVIQQWMEKNETIQLHRFLTWRGRKYSHWLSCTYVTMNIPIIIAWNSSQIRELERPARYAQRPSPGENRQAHKAKKL
jgi:hypothetical protein